MSTASLKAEVERLKARRAARRREVPADRTEFARGLLGIAPDPWQEDLLRSEAARVLLNCSRQSGKSTMASVLALHRALSRPGALVLLLAPSERQSKELFSKVSASYRSLGHAVPADSARKLGVELANGSRIEALPGTEKTIRGFSGVDLLIVDEAARVADELYYAVRPMLAVSGGALMMLSTPYGKRGVFHHEWTEGIGWERYRARARDCPRIPEAFLEEERRNMPAPWFRQEYECEFVETEDQVFAYDDVQAALDTDEEPLFAAGGGP